VPGEQETFGSELSQHVSGITEGGGEFACHPVSKLFSLDRRHLRVALGSDLGGATNETV
jgi:hypothetical protein